MFIFTCSLPLNSKYAKYWLWTRTVDTPIFGSHLSLPCLTVFPSNRGNWLLRAGREGPWGPDGGREDRPAGSPLLRNQHQDSDQDQGVQGIQGDPRFMLYIFYPTLDSCERFLFQSSVDKMMQKANNSMMVGSSSWLDQFSEAFTVQAGMSTNKA